MAPAMRDLSRNHILLFAVFFLALFAALFFGVVQAHKRLAQGHNTASYTPATTTSTN